MSIIFSILFYRYSTYEPPPPSEYRYESAYARSEYDVGYLLAGTTWVDGNGRSHINSSRVKIEVTSNTVVMANGSSRIQIFFLEGSNAGSWGYVNKNSISR